VRHETGAAVLRLLDVPVLRLGMTAKVDGPTNGKISAGVATSVESVVNLRGGVETLDRRRAASRSSGAR
jgi:hypothetical protein